MDQYPDFTYDLVPASWPVCFVANCPLAESCLSPLAGLHLPDDLTIGPAIYPTALRDGKCGHYKKIRKIQAAWGFDTLFTDVKQRDAAPLRSAIKNYLGGNGTYYRYHNGERLLTPEQQEHILALFRQCGYSENLHFDGYREVYDFS